MLEAGKQHFLVHHLAESARDFENAITTLDPELWNTRPEPDRWSVSEIAEHVMIIDGRVARSTTTISEWPEETYDIEHCLRKDQLVLRVAADRTTRIEAPEFVRPAGKLASPEQFYPDFRGAHELLMKLASGDSALLRGRFREHPVLKKLDGYQWLLACSCHRRRHLAQIEDAKSSIRR